MLFNSVEFAVFLPSVFLLYWFVFDRSITAQNLLVLVSSYFFYAWWDYRFLLLLFFSTCLDYFSGLQIHRSKNLSSRRVWLFLSVVANLGFLGFFKYFNFFVDSFASLLMHFNFQPNIWTLKIILPVGISFYTFHGLSYVFDIYNRRIEPTRKFIDYSVFVCFFPLLVAGPIERATHLLPQFFKRRVFSYAYAAVGVRLILWGLFKKMVVADNCAKIVNEVFTNYQTSSGLELVLGTIFFAFQIYGDFSGYSDIALGSARLFGFELLTNFKTPYFSRDIAEFWRRWHISLTTWFRDYVYIPMGGSRGGKYQVIKNTIIIFLISGFWHGANWTGRMLPSIKETLQMGMTFVLVCLAWVFFRSESLSAAFSYLYFMFDSVFFEFSLSSWRFFFPLILGYLILIDWLTREKGITNLNGKIVPIVFDLSLIVMIILFGSFNSNTFIYFQF